MSQIRPVRHNVRYLTFTCMSVDAGFGWPGCLRNCGTRATAGQAINNIVLPDFQLGLGEVLNQAGIASVARYDQDLPASITTHFRHSLLQQLQLQMGAVSYRSRLVLRLKDLTEIVLRENHCIFLLCCEGRRIADIQQVCPEGPARSMLLNDAERENTNSLCLLNRGDEIGAG